MTGQEIIKAVEDIKEYLDTLNRSIYQRRTVEQEKRKHLNEAQNAYDKAHIDLSAAFAERDELIASLEELKKALSPYLSN